MEGRKIEDIAHALDFRSPSPPGRGGLTSDALDRALPPTLFRLHVAREVAERDDAWTAFLAAHSDVVLHTCRSTIRDYDAAMDAYAFVIEALRENDFRRLRAYAPDNKTKFRTWLVAATRGLALDSFGHDARRPRGEQPREREGSPDANDHLQPMEIAAYVDDVATGSSRQRLERHLSKCTECRDAATEVARIAESFSTRRG